MKTLFAILLMTFSISGFAGSKKNILDIAKESGHFKTLVLALEATGLDKAIRSSKKITLFAPNDEAFAKLPEGTIEELLNNKEALKNILLYHVSPKKLKAKKVLRLKEVKTLQGQTAFVNIRNGEAYINESKIISTDIKAKNGIIHVLDNVLIFDESKPKNNIETEKSVNLKKYMGLWYEYARYDNRFQKECQGTTAEYTIKRTPLTRRKYVKVVNTCEKENGKIQKGKAKAFVANKETNATLKVSFVPLLNWFGAFAGDYNILKLGNDYEYALVGDRDRTTFWILSRTKTMPDALYQELLDVAESKGFRKELIKKRPVFTK